MNDLYETKISDTRWWAYDIPGNIGWITYIVVMIYLLCNPPAYMEIPLVLFSVIIGILPILAMLVGIIELISERIQKLDRILPKKRLYRGFGALTWGGIGGALIALNALFTCIRQGYLLNECYLFILLVIGGTLCALFAGLIYKSFHTQKEN